MKRRTKPFALRMIALADVLPANAKGRVLADQIVWSGRGPASGYGAACRGRSRADWVDKIGRGLEEADVTLLWLELIEEGGWLPVTRLAALKQEAAGLTVIFVLIHWWSKLQIRNHNS